MMLRPLTARIAELSVILKALADQHIPSIPLDEELDLVNRALRSGIESQAFRALEALILSAHASGLTRELVLHQSLAYREAVEVLRMSGKPLPIDL